MPRSVMQALFFLDVLGHEMGSSGVILTIIGYEDHDKPENTSIVCPTVPEIDGHPGDISC